MSHIVCSDFRIVTESQIFPGVYGSLGYERFLFLAQLVVKADIRQRILSATRMLLGYS